VVARPAVSAAAFVLDPSALLLVWNVLCVNRPIFRTTTAPKLVVTVVLPLTNPTLYLKSLLARLLLVLLLFREELLLTAHVMPPLSALRFDELEVVLRVER